MAQIRLVLDSPLTDDQLNELFFSAWPIHAQQSFQTELQHAFLNVTAWHNADLVGFVKLVWDGGLHAFLLDVTVHASKQKKGIGTLLVQRACQEARDRGIEWIHVDFEPHLTAFYLRCGFRPSSAGVLNLLNGQQPFEMEPGSKSIA